MLEALRNSRMGMRALFVLAALMVALMGASVMFNAPTSTLGSSLGTKEADAATYTTIRGTAIKMDSNTRVPGASVYLYRWNGQDWVNLGKKATTNSYGNYAIYNVPTGYYYQVRGWKVYGSCFTGAAAYDGWSTFFYVPGTSTGVNAAIKMSFSQWINC